MTESRGLKKVLEKQPWASYDRTAEQGEIHVVPLGDVIWHLFKDCPCSPDSRPYMGTVIVTHRAVDGRDEYDSLAHGQA